jgi:outer membrane receptor for ferrienterochelin and colicin
MLFRNLLTIFFCFNIASVNASDAYDIFEMSLAELATIEIATKRKQNVYSSPSTVSIISRQQLLNMGVFDLQTLLNYIPGFQSSRDIEQGTANRIAVRGRSTALSESVLVQIDGNKINDLYTGGISIINRLLSLSNIERIEVIRGPGSALYGGNAFLGVINIITASNLSQVSFSIDDSGSLSSQLLYHNEDKSLDVFISTFDAKGDEYNFVDLYGTNTLTRDPMKGHDLYIKYQLNDWQFVGRHMQRKLNDFLPLGSIGNGINEENTEQWSLTSKFDYEISSTSTLKFKAHYSKDEWDTIALLIPKNIEIAPGFALTSNFVGGPYLTSHTIKVDGELNYQLSEKQVITYGASYEQAEVDDVYTKTTHNLSTLEAYSTPIKLNGEDSFNVLKKRNISSLFIQDQIKFNPEWELTAGLRFDDYNDFGNTLNPRLAFVWKPNETSSLKLLYGSAFRAPNFLELYDKNNYVDFGNVNLSPEEVKTVELGWINTTDSWHWEITWFHNKFDQLIELAEPVEDIKNPFYAPQFMNQDNRESLGFETEIRLKLSSDFILQANYTWFNKSSDITVSRQAGTLILNYNYNDLNINFNHYYRGKSDLVSNQKSYWLSGINIRYDYSSSVSFALKAMNIFDKSYNTPALIYPNGVPNKGRSLTLMLEYNY